jgi:hypothetical protein
MSCYIKVDTNVQVELNKSEDRHNSKFLWSQHKGQHNPAYTKLTTHHLLFISPVFGLLPMSLVYKTLKEDVVYFK